jgi:DMSO/TMAO reductase YedYZ molybdopterin-dependent catalytic subunit
MSNSAERFIHEHLVVTRRWLLGWGSAGAAALCSWPLARADERRSPILREAIETLEPFFTPQDEFRDVSRGKPVPHSLDEETRRTVGLTRETWSMDVISDPDHPARLRNPLSAEKGNPFRFDDLMRLAGQHAVRFPKVMTCLNIGCPLGMGIWEGIPLREVVWLTEPREDLRRVFYSGFHNNKPEQLFRSSLPVGRILEDPFGLPPVILCYKLNGEWLTSERGGPVRIVVPEAYGFKSIKWVQRVVLSNLPHANDTYAEKNNDVDSPLKTFAATISVPSRVPAGSPFAVTGYAQVGISGLKKVQVWLQADGDDTPTGERYFSEAPWQDAELLPPPENWGGNLPDGRIPAKTTGFAADGMTPLSWPLSLGKIHWAYLFPGLPAGNYTLRSRTIDAQGYAQPMPRPFRKSGHSAIEQVGVRVEDKPQPASM